MSKRYFDQDVAYRLLKKDLQKQYSKDVVERIYENAAHRLDELKEKYQEMPKEDKVHTLTSIFLRIAMYEALKEELPEEALNIMNAIVNKTGNMVGNFLHYLTKIPGMKSIFLKVFSSLTKTHFGPSAGFSQHIHIDTAKELNFDILDCPYCRYCKKCGCEELITTFCDSDVYCYGNLSGISFDRTKTLGTGGDCCDFHLRKN